LKHPSAGSLLCPAFDALVQVVMLGELAVYQGPGNVVPEI